LTEAALPNEAAPEAMVDQLAAAVHAPQAEPAPAPQAEPAPAPQAQAEPAPQAETAQPEVTEE
jgi:pyruvate dehydrogenase E2 component (dihydrolipoyllysine-residue acetyltransferase)